MSIKIGNKVEVLFFEEGRHDAPDDYIGASKALETLYEIIEG